MPRTRYNEELKDLYLSLIKMGALSEDALKSAMASLFEHDSEEAEQTSSIESDIDEKQKDIESLCVKLILEQQPVAGDLRMISAAMKMTTDIERIGDIALDIAEITGYITDDSLVKQIPLREMSDAASAMVAQSVQAYVESDVSLAESVIHMDDTVDGQFSQIQSFIMDEIRRSRASGVMCIDLMMVAKYLERIADHAVNISESVVYAVTGERNPA